MRSLLQFVMTIVMSMGLSFLTPFLGVILGIVLALLVYSDGGKPSQRQKEILIALVLGGFLGTLLYFNPIAF